MINQSKINQSIKCLLKLSTNTNTNTNSTKNNTKNSTNTTNNNNLLEINNQNNDFIFAIFGLKKMAEKTSIKPIVVPLKNSIYSCVGNEISTTHMNATSDDTNANTTSDDTNANTTSTNATTSTTTRTTKNTTNNITKNTINNDSAPLEICLFVKDPQREYKNLIFNELSLNNNSSTGSNQSFKIAKIIDISKLRKKYKEFEAKRILCNSFDLFLADERVLPLLPKLLGKYFFNKKKYGICLLYSMITYWFIFYHIGLYSILLIGLYYILVYILYYILVYIL